jgi:transposase-like protein
MTATLGDVPKRREKPEPTGEQQVAEELVRRPREQGLSLTGLDGLLKQLTKTVLETALNQELTEHLGHEKHAPPEPGSGNVRNGTCSKTVLTEATGEVGIDVPRDRAGTFEPQIVRKRQRRLVKVRDGQVANRPIYAAIGVTLAGQKDILGLWAGTEGEGAKFWMAVLTDIRNRGVRDVFFVVCDGLKGLPGVVGNVWPLAIVQTCIIHLIVSADVPGRRAQGAPVRLKQLPHRRVTWSQKKGSSSWPGRSRPAASRRA